jgi:hypothetical protein
LPRGAISEFHVRGGIPGREKFRESSFPVSFTQTARGKKPGACQLPGGVCRRGSYTEIEMFKPVAVQPLPDHKLRLWYEDGIEGIVDLSHLAGQGVFALWNDPESFQNVSIGPSGQIRWSEEVELCPDALYLEISGKSAEEVFPSLRGTPLHA